MNGKSETPRRIISSADNTYRTPTLRYPTRHNCLYEEKRGRRHDLLDEGTTETRPLSAECIAIRQISDEIAAGAHGDATLDKVVRRYANMELNCGQPGIYSRCLTFFT
jgi:hypothetical protein